MAEEADDPIVREIDVYMATKLANMLALAQFPLRPAWHPLPDTLAGARIKPQQVRFELDLARETKGEHYDGNSAPAGTGGDRETLRSAQVPLQTNYSVGVLREGSGSGNDELHLTPVYTVLQMRPTFSALDEADRKRREQEMADEAEETGLPGAQPKAAQEDDGQALQVTFKKRDAPNSASAKRLMAQEREKRDENEPFVQLKLVAPGSDEHTAVLEWLVCARRDARVRFDVTRQEYLDLLAPIPPVEEYVRRQHEVMLRDNTSMEELRRMQPLARVRSLLLAAGSLSFAKLAELAGCSPAETLHNLQQVAVLAGQRWVARSDVAASGAYALVREWALWKMHVGERVTRKELAEASGAPHAALTRMVSRFAKQDRARGTWVLKGEPDVGFYSSPEYAHVVRDFEGYWESKAATIEEGIRRVKSGEVSLGPTVADPCAPPPKTPTKGSAAPGRVVPPAADFAYGTGAAAEMAAANPELVEYFKERFTSMGVCNIVLLRTKLDERVADSKNMLYNKKFSDEVFKGVLSHLAYTLHGGWFLKTAGEQEVDEVRNVVIDLFRKHVSVPRHNIKIECQKVLKTGNISTKALKRALEELAVLKSSSWIFKAAAQGSGYQQ